MIRTVLTLTAALTLFGCASSGTASGPEPDVTLIQLSRAAEGTQYDTGPVTTHYAVEVKNTLTESIRLDRVNVQSIGGGAYTLPAYSQAFNETLAPGETKQVAFWAPGYVATPTVAGSNGPVTVRGILDFTAAGKKFQKVVVQNIASYGGN
jgi:hypothetical protein